ncbi:MAG: PTS sugar transporter subunit IIA [Desulfovibrionaceae bacterium]
MNMNAASTSPQVGLLLVTHGTFGAALLDAASMIMGPQAGCETVSVAVDSGPDQTVEAIRAAVERLDAGAGVLALTDLFGGSPTTLSLSLVNSQKVEVVTGVNLPMLVKALRERGRGLDELAALARDAGQQGIKVAGEMLRRRAAAN